MDQKKTIFRKKTMDRISSPEQLTDYLCVTTPGIWVIFAAVILLLGGLFAWAAIGTLETTAEVRVIVEDRTAQVVSSGSETITGGMPLRIEKQEFKIASTGTDEYGRTVGLAEVSLPDGVYDGTLVIERTKPLAFLLESR